MSKDSSELELEFDLESYSFKDVAGEIFEELDELEEPPSDLELMWLDPDSRVIVIKCW